MLLEVSKILLLLLPVSLVGEQLPSRAAGSGNPWVKFVRLGPGCARWCGDLHHRYTGLTPWSRFRASSGSESTSVFILLLKIGSKKVICTTKKFRRFAPILPNRHFAVVLPSKNISCLTNDRNITRARSAIFLLLVFQLYFSKFVTIFGIVLYQNSSNACTIIQSGQKIHPILRNFPTISNFPERQKIGEILNLFRWKNIGKHLCLPKLTLYRRRRLRSRMLQISELVQRLFIPRIVTVVWIHLTLDLPTVFRTIKSVLSGLTLGEKTQSSCSSR